jgi:hypothetical protein
MAMILSIPKAFLDLHQKQEAKHINGLSWLLFNSHCSDTRVAGIWSSLFAFIEACDTSFILDFTVYCRP